MKLRLIIAVLVIVTYDGVRAQDRMNGIVGGQVFVVTAGGQSYKLGDVEVGFYPSPIISAYMKDREADAQEPRNRLLAASKIIIDDYKQKNAKREDAQKARIAHISDNAYERAYQDCVAEWTSSATKVAEVKDADIYNLSAYYFFQAIPAPIQVTRTDADGKYSLLIPRDGTFFLAAHAKRSVGADEEEYYWLVAVSLKGGEKTTLNLANENMASGSSPLSLLHTIDSKLEPKARQGEIAMQKIFSFLDAVRQTTQKESENPVPQPTAAKPEPSQNSPRLVKESQARAISKYPELGRAGSAFNQKFIAAYEKLKATHDPVLEAPDWPERLANSCADIQ